MLAASNMSLPFPLHTIVLTTVYLRVVVVVLYMFYGDQSSLEMAFSNRKLVDWYCFYECC